MPGGVYSALSGMQARLDDLDRLASDLANVGTSGYKTERTATSAAERPSFRTVLDVGGGRRRRARRASTSGRAPSASTGRDLDVAIEGPGFFAIVDPGRRALHAQRRVEPPGRRRADHGRRAADPRADGAGPAAPRDPGRPRARSASARTAPSAVGRRRRRQAAGRSSSTTRATCSANRGCAFEPPSRRRRPKDAESRIVGGALEQANVSMVDRMAALTEVSAQLRGAAAGRLGADERHRRRAPSPSWDAGKT